MEIVNIGITAHVDAGKTTLTEQLLYKCGEVKLAGSIKNGSTRTDWLPVERERGISVKSSSASVEYKTLRINLIDTPGHADFAGEVERAFLALDAVILVISAAEGIQSQTELFWRAISEAGLPCIIFINKVDRSAADTKKLISQIREKFSSNIIRLNSVSGEGLKDYSLGEAEFGEDELFMLCEHDEDIAKKYLNGGAVLREEILDTAAELSKRAIVFPVVFGAASDGEGITALLEAIRLYLPRAGTNADCAPSGIIYKIEHNKGLGKIAHIRLFEGSLKPREPIRISRPGEEGTIEKPTFIKKVSGSKYTDTKILEGGDIAAVCGLSGAKTGDIIGELAQIRGLRLAEPLFQVQVTGDSGKEAELLSAVIELTDEDPLLGCEWNTSERELVIKIMGPIQLEVLEYLLKERYGITAFFSNPSVIYKETPARSGKGIESYTMPKPCWAVVELRFDPLARGEGYYFESLVRDSDIFFKYQNHIRTSITESLKQGLFNWEVTDLKATLTGGEHHVLHTHPMDFFVATPVAVMKTLENCGSTLLEPLITAKISAGEEFSSKIIGDIIAMRGEFESPVISNGIFEIEASLPVRDSAEYPARLASLTSGKGIYRTAFKGYRECPPELGASAKRRGINPLDRSKWIMSMKKGVL